MEKRYIIRHEKNYMARYEKRAAARQWGLGYPTPPIEVGLRTDNMIEFCWFLFYDRMEMWFPWVGIYLIPGREL